MVRISPLPPLAKAINGLRSRSYKSWRKVSFKRYVMLVFIILSGFCLLFAPMYYLMLDQSYPVEVQGWGYNTTRNASVYIHPEKTTSILNPDGICDKSTYLIIVVLSAVSNFNRRLAIRRTWGDKIHLDNLFLSTVKLVFLLGESDNDILNNDVIRESYIYNDLIQESFHDTYQNLTLKSLMMLKWITNHCKKSTYLMKIDDDSLLNVTNLYKILLTQTENTGALIGHMIQNASPYREPNNKWYCPEYMYSESTFPDFVRGGSYVMSLDVAQDLYKTALTTPILHLEDVYLTGVCAKKIGIKPTNVCGFTVNFEICDTSNFITSQDFDPDYLMTVWAKLSSPYACNFMDAISMAIKNVFVFFKKVTKIWVKLC